MPERCEGDGNVGEVRSLALGRQGMAFGRFSQRVYEE
jgi:hypothetical protein